MTAAEFVAFAGELSGLPRDEAISRAHEVLYYVGPRRGPLPQGRDVLDRHEAAGEARPGPRARPRPPAPRRADERPRPPGPRGDARPHPRHRDPAGDEPHPLLAPPARRRAGLRERGRLQPGPGGEGGHDPRAHRRPPARLRRALQGRRRGRPHRPQGPRAPSGTRARTGCGSSCPRATGRRRSSAWRRSAGCRCGTSAPAPRRSRTCSCAPSGTRSRPDADLRPGLPAVRGAGAAPPDPLLADHARGAAAHPRQAGVPGPPRRLLPALRRARGPDLHRHALPRGGPGPAHRRAPLRRLPERADRLHDPAARSSAPRASSRTTCGRARSSSTCRARSPSGTTSRASSSSPCR